MRQILIVIYLCFVPTLLWADPSVISFVGTLSSGETITISGSGFGAGPTVYHWNNFENNTLGEDLDADDGYKDEATPDPVVVNTNQRTNSTQCAYAVEGTSDLIYDHGETLSSVYASWWMKFNRTATSGINTKYFILFPSLATDHDPWVTSTQLGTSSETTTIYASTGYIYQGVYWGGASNNTWQRYELTGIESSSPGGVFDGTADGTVQYSIQIGGEGNTFTSIVNFDGNTTTNGSGLSDHWQQLDLMYMSQENTPIWTDDLYIASSRARVEIGDASTLAACTHREVQGTINSWSASSISIDVNQGSFAAEDEVYVIVVASDGTEGYYGPLEIGGSYPSTPSIRNGGVRSGGFR